MDKIRIRKVIGIFATQLAITMVINLAILNSEYGLKLAMNIFPLCIVGVIVTVIMISCCDGPARNVPQNYILLLIATVCESVLVALAVKPYPMELVGAALLLTIGKNYSQFFNFNFI